MKMGDEDKDGAGDEDEDEDEDKSLKCRSKMEIYNEYRGWRSKMKMDDADGNRR